LETRASGLNERKEAAKNLGEKTVNAKSPQKKGVFSKFPRMPKKGAHRKRKKPEWKVFHKRKKAWLWKVQKKVNVCKK